MANWECEEHDARIVILKGEPEEVLKEVPPKCSETGEPMERVE